MVKYFREYSGGIKDVIDTLDIFSETMQKFVIPEIPLRELERIRNLFIGDPFALLERVRHALLESEDVVEIKGVEYTLRALCENLENLAKDRGITLVLGKNGAKDSEAANKDKDPLEYRVFNILYVCIEKLAALFTYKRAQIELSRKKLT